MAKAKVFEEGHSTAAGEVTKPALHGLHHHNSTKTVLLKALSQQHLKFANIKAHTLLLNIYIDR